MWLLPLFLQTGMKDLDPQVLSLAQPVINGVNGRGVVDGRGAAE
jgi:hypothetical protein